MTIEHILFPARPYIVAREAFAFGHIRHRCEYPVHLSLSAQNEISSKNWKVFGTRHHEPYVWLSRASFALSLAHRPTVFCVTEGGNTECLLYWSSKYQFPLDDRFISPFAFPFRDAASLFPFCPCIRHATFFSSLSSQGEARNQIHLSLFLSAATDFHILPSPFLTFYYPTNYSI